MELNKIYCMDAIKGLKQLDDESIDLVLTDPPYGTNDGKGKLIGVANKDKVRGISFDNFCVHEWDKEFHFKFIDELPRIMKEDTWGVIFTDNALISHVWDKIEKVGLSPRNTFYIIKKDKPPVPRCNFISSVETAVVFTKGRTTIKWLGGSKGSNGSITRNYQIVNQLTNTEKRYHPTQKHITTIRNLIKLLSQEGDTILDCYMGSGTTAVACKQTNRNFIGFELEKKYFNLANKRLVQENLKEWFKN